MDNKQILGDIALDLKRVAIGFHRGSEAMAMRFIDEAIKRRSEIDEKNIKPYLKKILEDLIKIKTDKKEKAAEDALMYSTIIQNASQAI